MTTNGLDTVADQLKAAAEQYGNEAAELEQQAKTLRDKQARVAAAVAALAGSTMRTAEPAKRAPRRAFTETDDAYIRTNWGTKRPAHIARDLGRLQGALTRRAEHLGLVVKASPAA